MRTIESLTFHCARLGPAVACSRTELLTAALTGMNHSSDLLKLSLKVPEQLFMITPLCLIRLQHEVNHKTTITGISAGIGRGSFTTQFSFRLGSPGDPGNSRLKEKENRPGLANAIESSRSLQSPHAECSDQRKADLWHWDELVVS